MEDIGLLNAVFENMPEGMLITDANGVILASNPSACRLFGYSAGEMKHRPVSQLFDGNNQDLIDEFPAMNFCKKINSLKKDGSGFTALLSFNPVRHQDNAFLVLLIYKETNQDHPDAPTVVLEGKKLQQLKTRFVSMASHEFRTPLSAIQLSATLIERYYDHLERSKVFHHLHKIKRSVLALTAMLEDFLSVEKISSDQVSIDYQEFNLQTFCQMLAMDMQAEAKSTVVIDYQHTGEMTSVFSDKDLLHQCVAKLLSNAIKYSREKGTVRLQSAILKNKCILSVTDRGIGIPFKDQAHLGEAFFRGKNTVGIPGTGLGLHMVKYYVQLMDGELGFESVENNGSCFTLSFPNRR